MSRPIAIESDADYLCRLADICDLEVQDFSPPRPRRFEANSVQLHYWDWGRLGSSPLILLLHGYGLNGRSWDAVCLALRAHGHCIALDVRGHGRSAWPKEPDYSLDAISDDLRVFLDYLESDRVVLVGHSWGGMNALAFTAEYPDRVGGLGLVDSGPEFHSDGIKKIDSFVNSAATAMTIDEHMERALEFNPRRDPDLLQWSLQLNLRKLENDRWEPLYDRRLVQRSANTAHQMEDRTQRLWNDLRRIQAPVLILRGAESALIRRSDAMEFAQAAPKGKWEEIPCAGHNIHGDNPKLLAESLARFIARHSNGQS